MVEVATPRPRSSGILESSDESARAEGLSHPKPLPKCPTGIAGRDEVTLGGLPRGRPTLVCGTAGCGKSLLGVEFLVHGAVLYGEPGVLVSFEETEDEIATNVASLGFDLPALVAKKKLAVEHVHLERSEISETGAYNLDGLFIRIGMAIARWAPRGSCSTRWRCSLPA